MRPTSRRMRGRDSGHGRVDSAALGGSHRAVPRPSAARPTIRDGCRRPRTAACAAGAMLLSACSSTQSPAASSGGGGGGGSAAGCTIGMSWNNYQEERWAKWDEPAIKSTIEAAGGKYVANDAKSSAETQA